MAALVLALTPACAGGDDGEAAEARLARLDAGLRSVTAGLPENVDNPGVDFTMAECLAGPDGTQVFFGTALSQQWLVLEGEPFTLLDDLDSEVLAVFPHATPNGGDTGLPDPFVTRGWDLGGGYTVSMRAIADRSLGFSISLGCGEPADPVM